LKVIQTGTILKLGFMRYLDSKNSMTLKTGLGVVPGH